jgi:YHS domain-containing protein
MEESRFDDKILTYKDAGKAVKGGEYYFSDNFYELSTDPQGVPMGTLKEINVNLSYPFTAKESGYSYQYAIPAELVEGRKKAFDRSKIIWAGNLKYAEEGKQYFFADRIAELEENAEMNKNADCLQKVRPEAIYPFRNKGSSYAMIYPVSVEDGELDKSRLVTEENADSRLGRLCVFSDSMEALKKNLRSQEHYGVSRLQSFTLNAGSAVFTDGSGTPWRLAYDVTGLAWAKKPQLTDVITVLNPEDAEIGKSYRFADDLGSFAEGSAAKGTLTRIEEGLKYPFYDGEGEPYRCIVPENN